MAKNKDKNIIDYDILVDSALRNVVKSIIQFTIDEKDLGNHHFFITFKTNHPNVNIPQKFLEIYPDEMTIVLQHQFWKLKLEEDSFSVTLSFNGKHENLKIAFDSITQFTDPSTDFALQFASLNKEIEEEKIHKNNSSKKDPKVKPNQNSKNKKNNSGEVISLDNFRKTR